LIDFQQADELGNYRFLTPLFYGSSQLDLRIYGPTGQIVTRSSRIQVPFIFTPQGELNYRINAGVLDNTIIGSTVRNKMLQANGSYGVTKWLTSKLGVEYFTEELGTGSPYFTGILSSRISSNYILSLEGVSNAYYRATLNAIYPSAASINFDYTDYYAGESIFNSSNNDRQLTSSVFIPLRIFKLPFNVRLSNFSRSREGTTTNSIRLDVNSRINKLNLRLGYSDRLIDTFNPFNSTQGNTLEGSATYTISRNPNIPTVLRGTFLRAQLRFLPEQNELQNAEFLFSKNVLKIGRLQVSMGRNFISEFNTIRANFVIDFKRVRSNTTVTAIRKNVSSTQNIRGSIGYDSNFNNMIFTARDQVGRSGAAIQLFVDRNANGTYDEGDELLPDAELRIGRNGSQYMYKNGVLYYTQMRPYFRYNMEVNTATIKNPMLIPELDKFSMITDPNGFKPIRIPFNVSGVMEGLVERRYEDGQRQGIGGLKILLTEHGESSPKELRTFSDGSFYDYPISPGLYNIKVDPTQLNILQTRSEPEEIEFEVKVTPDGDYIEGINFTLLPLEEIESSEEDSLAALTIAQVTDEIKSSPEILEYSQEVFQEVDDALRRIIQAQNAFYSNNIDLAFRYVNESLELFETAQAHALKGSFYYFEGNIDQAQRHWEQALRFNPDLVIPDMEVLEERVNRRASD
jgi:tetratricopeptide (TPR) repeat protein